MTSNRVHQQVQVIFRDLLVKFMSKFQRHILITRANLDSEYYFQIDRILNQYSCIKNSMKFIISVIVSKDNKENFIGVQKN
jgi:hypothetical protein